ncbi:neuronal acetylcholine receptor subunit alpha-3-like [Mytilus trossulus]|uniref:neuronal acetylcholine receptor subunit alpha-3-like n=1 Tax=Mytilus trossulus TaxID=6551 RepID=UPI00300726E9
MVCKCFHHIRMILLLLLTKFGLILASDDYSTSLETELREEIFDDYVVQQRPNGTIFIMITLNLLTVNDLDIKKQELTVSGHLSITWYDNRLNWTDPSKYYADFTSINYLFSSETHVWKPTLVIKNSIRDIGVLTDPSIPMRISQTGKIFWNPPGIYKVSCKSDITYYPFDTQACTIKLISWAYTTGEVILKINQNDAVNIVDYTENGEWELISTSEHKASTEVTEGTTGFSSLFFSIKLRRRPMFHIINSILPMSLMAVLIAVVFKLPVDSGEKTGFSLTVLLAYGVYLTIISDEIPSTSVSTSYLSLYLVFILTLGVLAILLTIVIQRIHFKTEDEEIPEWLQRITKQCYTKISGKDTKKDHTDLKSQSMNLKRHSVAPIQLNETTEKINSVEAGDIKITWQIVARILDKAFFYVYITLISITTFIFILTLVIHYYTA